MYGKNMTDTRIYNYLLKLSEKKKIDPAHKEHYAMMIYKIAVIRGFDMGNDMLTCEVSIDDITAELDIPRSTVWVSLQRLSKQKLISYGKLIKTGRKHPRYYKQRFIFL
jgi:CRP-like cAMP-binding protein